MLQYLTVVCAAPASLSDGGQPIGPRKSVPVRVLGTVAAAAVSPPN
jgi:hypothetical protein